MNKLDGVSELEVRLLGQASIVAGGVPVKFAKRATTIAVLGLLILRRGEAVSREELAATLFPDLHGGTALAELGRYIGLTNRALPPRAGEPWLIADSESVRWNVAGNAFIDAIEFERLATNPQTQAAAVDRYAGDLLEDLYDDWVVAERERLRGLYLQALHDLITSHQMAREHPSALGYARRFLAIEPWREDVVRQIMEIHYASGDSSGALAEYERFATQLRVEVGISPMPETLALREAIVRGEALTVSIDSTFSTRSGGVEHRVVRALPFIGRETERGALQAEWDRAMRGFGGVVLISGEAGVGKTRLVGELTQLAQAQGSAVYTGSTSSPESSPYQCIVEALRAALPIVTARGLDPLTRGVLSRILPELRAQSGDELGVAELEPDREVARLFASLADVVVRLASAHPLLLVLEDLHWAAGGTIEAIAAIARRIDRARMLIVVTYREEDTPATHPVRTFADALGPDRRTTRLRLERFSRDDVTQLVAQLDEFGTRDDAMVERLYAFSEGNALFLSEAIADAVESTGDTGPEPMSPLRGIGNVVAARVARLSDIGRMVAEVTAICGDGASVDIVCDVAGLSVAQTRDALDELLDRRLVREAGARDRFDYVFTHHLIGTSIYDQIEDHVRTRRHARIAYLLEERAAQRAGLIRDLARHYDLAGLENQAGRWYLHAASAAAAVYANEDTVALATLAIDRLIDDALLVKALLVREEVNGRLGARNAQAADLDRLESLANTPELRCSVLGRRVAFLRSSDDRAAETDAITALKAQALELGDHAWQGRAALAAARLYIATTNFRDASESAQEALAHFEGAGTQRDRIEALLALSYAKGSTYDRDEAHRLLDQANATALKSSDRSLIALVAMESVLVQGLFRQRALEPCEKALQSCRAIGDRIGEANMLITIANRALWLMRWDRAVEAISAAARILEATNDRIGLMRLAAARSQLYMRCGDFDRAYVFNEETLERLAQLGNRKLLAYGLCNKACIAISQGRPREAKMVALATLNLEEELGHLNFIYPTLATLALAERELGELDAAMASAKKALDIIRQFREFDATDIEYLSDIALIHALRGEIDAALNWSRQAHAFNESPNELNLFPPEAPWINARVFHWAGEEELAGEALGRAARLVEETVASFNEPKMRAHYEALPFYKGIADAVGGHWPPAPWKRPR